MKTRSHSRAAAGAVALLVAAMPAVASDPPASAVPGDRAADSPSQLAPAADPAAPAAELRRAGALDDYRPLPSLAPLPWRSLFDAQGAFVDHDGAGATRTAQAQVHAQHQAGTQAPASPAAAPASDAAGDAIPAGADGVATVLRIDRDAKRVRLRHGPIRRLEMPGMTMLFQVADPGLLDAVAEGETVGFKVEQRGQAFVITDWVRGR